METITPLENRILLTTLGDWTGAGYWTPSGYPTEYGKMEFALPAASGPQQGVLSYPQVSPGPGFTHVFRFWLFRDVYGWLGPYSWQLTDGVNTFGGDVYPDPGQALHLVEEVLDIPAGWDVGNTILTLTFTSMPASDSYISCSKFTLEYVIPSEKIQYLPIMGVG